MSRCKTKLNVLTLKFTNFLAITRNLLKMMRYLLIITLCITALQANAEVRITDIVDRTVVLKAPAKKVLLGEGRFLAVLGVLGVKQPLSRVAGMMNEFQRFDPTGFERYRQAFPHIDRVTTFGQTSEDTVSVEQAILAQPDAAIFGMQGHGPGSRSRYIIDRLEAAGIPVVFIDFRQQPLKHTARSVEIVGEVLGLQAQAKAFSQLYQTEVEKVTKRLRTSPPKHCPSVVMEVRVETQQPCCLTIAKGMFANLVEAAGGCNIAKPLLTGAVGELNVEHVIASKPEIYLGTAIGAPDSQTHIALGAGVDLDTARQSLERVLKRKGLPEMSAIAEGRAYALWHHFYNSPLNVYALQKLAQWLHPSLFKDLQPEQMLEQLLAGFAPVDLQGVYAISLQ